MESNSGWKPSESCKRHNRNRPVQETPHLFADNGQQLWQNRIAHIGCRSPETSPIDSGRHEWLQHFQLTTPLAFRLK